MSSTMDIVHMDKAENAIRKTGKNKEKMVTTANARLTLKPATVGISVSLFLALLGFARI